MIFMQLVLSLVLLAWPKSTKRSGRWIPEAVRYGYAAWIQGPALKTYKSWLIHTLRGLGFVRHRSTLRTGNSRPTDLNWKGDFL